MSKREDASEPSPPGASQSRASPPSAAQAGASWGPVLGGLLLDAVDAATFGPLGLQLGLPIGALAGWLLTGGSGLSSQTRLFVAAAAGVYCMLPFTSFLPLATLVGAILRFWPRRSSAALPPHSAVEVEYEGRWEPAEREEDKGKSGPVR